MYEHYFSNYIQYRSISRLFPGILAKTQTFSVFIDIFEFQTHASDVLAVFCQTYIFVCHVWPSAIIITMNSFTTCNTI